jgi:hypothetical protein
MCDAVLAGFDAAVRRASLRDLICVRGTPCVERLADIDVLLDELEADPGCIHRSVLASLIAAGRFDAASRALRVLEPMAQRDRSPAFWRDAEYARRLRALIDRRGAAPLP